MLRETILSAVVAGIVAALLLTLVQSVWVTPLILQAETYEDAAEAAVSHHDSAPSSAGHDHDPAAWKPQEGLQRTLFTFGANLLMGVGYAFVLVAFYLLWREPKNALWGAAYGVGGFVVFFAAPGMGLPPELPGTAAAELTTRQEWWVLTAVASGAGLIVFFSASKWWVRVLALALLVAPHLIPAPQPAVEASLVPDELQSRFRLATIFCNAVFWLSLGLASSIVFRKMVPVSAHARG
jgi:cobalt transporter subunit CbtA